MVARRIEDPLNAEERARASAGVASLKSVLSWFDAHYAELLQAHPDQWVAVSEDGVVDVAESFDELVSRVDNQAVRDGTIVVEFLPSRPLNLILSTHEGSMARRTSE